MNKYFIVSDLHSFYTPFKDALDEKGFDINNKEHILVICGDLFDRGDETLEIYKFIKSIPKKRRILIKGNHEQLYLDLLKKELPESYDYSNGTVKTFCHIAKVPEIQSFESFYYKAEGLEKEFQIRWNNIKNKVAKSVITKWLQSDEWLNFYEIKNYILVHSFIPLECIDKLPFYYTEKRSFKYISDWRNASEEAWNEARWGCPWRLFKDGLFDEEIKNNRILVCGHWHASDFHNVFEKNIENPRFSYNDDFSTYVGKNLIALDACTAATNNCNVYIIEGD